LVAGSRVLKLRRDDSCVVCNENRPAGTSAYWDADAKTVTCLTCHSRAGEKPLDEEVAGAHDQRAGEPVVTAATPAPLERGTPGASARRRYAKLHHEREQRVKDKLGRRLGGVYLALSEGTQSTVAWAQGARGERLLGEFLEQLHDDETVIVLHDRRIPGTRANIDHIAITRSGGVWAIDAKNYTGKVQRIDKGGWLSSDERLYVGGRDCTKLVAAMAKQRKAIESSISEPIRQEFHVDVKTALCFVDAEWSFFAKPFGLQGVWIGWAKALGERLRAPGELAPEHLRMLARRVADALPGA
jgi:hypothetical protein